MRTNGVYPVRFHGGKAWKIIWNGEPLQMYWGSLREARYHLWMLRHPPAAKFICQAMTRDSAVPFVERFPGLRSVFMRMNKE